MTYTPFPVWPAPEGGEGGGVTSHGALTGRSSADQHPTSAITGLDAALAVGEQTVLTVTSAIAMDLTGIIELGVDPVPTPVGWFTAIFGQADPSLNGIWEGQTVDPGGDPGDYLPFVKRSNLPTENGVIFAEVFGYDADTLFASVEGGWIIAQATDTSDNGGMGSFGALPGDGWAVVYGTQYWLDTIAGYVEYRSRWRMPRYGRQSRRTPRPTTHTITWASDIQGPVYTMEAATDKTFTLDETSGGWASGAILRFHNIGTGLLAVEPDAAATFTAGAKAVASFSVLPGGWAQAWRSPNNDGEWIVTGDNEAWLWDGVSDYLPAYGARRFVGPNDPAGEGFTLSDGDQWEDTTP
jgi:hypothetical protein